MKTSLIIGLISLSISGCATKYKEMVKSDGYEDEKLNDRLYRITFQGNSRTSDDKVRKYFLRRSAEVALFNHYQYFTIVESEDITKSTTVTSKGVPPTKARVAVLPNYGESSYYPAEYKSIHKHALTGKIELFKEGEQPMNAYKVEEILKDVKP